jgi:hypothetical protein
MISSLKTFIYSNYGPYSKCSSCTIITEILSGLQFQDYGFYTFLKWTAMCFRNLLSGLLIFWFLSFTVLWGDLADIIRLACDTRFWKWVRVAIEVLILSGHHPGYQRLFVPNVNLIDPVSTAVLSIFMSHIYSPALAHPFVWGMWFFSL